MDEIKNWISGICSISIMISVLKAVLPEGYVERAFNVTASLLLIIVVIAPFKQLNLNEFRLEIERNEEALTEKIEEVNDKNAKLTDDIIEAEVCEYICSKTSTKKEDISVTCENGEIKQVIIYKNSQKVRALLEKELKIPTEIIIEQGA